MSMTRRELKYTERERAQVHTPHVDSVRGCRPWEMRVPRVPFLQFFRPRRSLVDRLPSRHITFMNLLKADLPQKFEDIGVAKGEQVASLMKVARVVYDMVRLLIFNFET